MKKVLILLLTGMLVLSLTACKSEDNNKDSTEKKTTEKQTSAEEKKTDKTDKTDKEAGSAKDSLELLETVWNSYKDDEKFPVGGGDMSEENMKMDAPGKYGLGDTEALDATLGFPAGSVDKIDDAASMMHMMNANTFTCGVFRVKNAGDMDALTAELKDHIMQRQWMCGFPDKLVILTVDNYIISFFGENEIINTFKGKVTAAYSSAKTVCEESLAE